MAGKHRWLLWVGLVGLGLALAGSAQAADCKVSIKSEEVGQEDRIDFVMHSFYIEPELKTNIECAKLEYDLVVVEKAADGSQQTKRIRKGIKLKRGEAKARKVVHRVPKSSKLVSWKFETYRCYPCGTR